MKKRKITALIVFSVIIIVIGLYLLLPGFAKRGDVYLADYAVSADGRAITLTVGVMSSAGYVRDVAVHQQQGGRLYLDCYSAFGGINGAIGGGSQYTILLDEDTEIIALYRANNSYEPVLQKDASGVWRKV